MPTASSAFWLWVRYGSYGPNVGDLHGARVVELVEGEDPATAATWIRLESGLKEVQATITDMSSKLELLKQTQCSGN